MVHSCTFTQNNPLHNVDNGRATSEMGFNTKEAPRWAAAPRRVGAPGTCLLPFPPLQTPFASPDPTCVHSRRTCGKGRPCGKSPRPQWSPRLLGSWAPPSSPGAWESVSHLARASCCPNQHHIKGRTGGCWGATCRQQTHGLSLRTSLWDAPMQGLNSPKSMLPLTATPAACNAWAPIPRV